MMEEKKASITTLMILTTNIEKKVDIYQINLNFYAIFVAVLDILVRPYELLD